MKEKHVYVLGIHPSSRGFGWTLFEDEHSPFDWGTATVQHGDNDAAVARVCQLFEKYKPRILVLEEFEDSASRRAPRIRALYRAIIGLANSRGIAVRRYTREQIGDTLNARTREDTSAAVATRIDQLRPRLPKHRNIWDSEHPNLALFSAAACVLTHYALADR